jgi:two-component system, chemotaxis family, CheB/CheR fusion protein
MNILKMARDGLRRDLTAALHRAAAHGETVRTSGLKFRTDGGSAVACVIVRPVAIGSEAGKPGAFLVVFEETPTAAEASTAPEAAGAETRTGDGGAPPPGSAEPDARIAALKRELEAKEEILQSSNEELETSNEELKSITEEMQSVNEELQSTNEELETSKEELQSVNEELTTVNSELQQKVLDLSRANNDLNNLLAATEVGTIFVDHQLRIQRFTPAVTQVINLISADVGRPVGHIVSNLQGYDDLVKDLKEVLGTLVPKEVEVLTKAGACFQLRIRPYRTLDNVIEGAVITFFDITEIKRVRDSLRDLETQRRLAAVVGDSRDAIAVLDLDGRILAWNPGAARMYGWSEEEALGMNVRDLVPRGAVEGTADLLRRLSLAGTIEPRRMQRVAKGGAIVEITLTATALTRDTGEVYAIATTERLLP